MNRMSLRTKGLILILLISLLPLLLAGFGNYSAVKSAMLDAEQKRISSRQASLASSVSSWMDIRKAEVLVMSRTHVVRSGTTLERLAYFESEMDRSDFSYHRIGFINNDGYGIGTDGRGSDMSEEVFTQASLAGSVTVTDPYIPSYSETRQTIIAAPVRNENFEVIGVIYASIPFTAFNRFFNPAEEQSELLWYNDAGHILFRSRDVPEQQTGELSAAEMALQQKVISQNEGVTEIVDEKVTYLVFFSKIQGTPWIIALQEPMSKINGVLTSILWRIVTPIAIAEAIIACLFYVYFDRIVKRLERILSVTEQAAAGDFHSAPLPITQRDEIDLLASSVNGMMDHLQKMFDRLDAIINQNQYGFIVLDDQYRVTYLNKAAEEMIGYSTEELAGHATPMQFMDREDIAQEAARLSMQLGREISPDIEVFKALRELNFSYEREWMFIHKDGTRIPMMHSSNGLRDQYGRFTGVVGMIHNISDRKQVEKTRNRLLNIVESAKDLIASISQDGTVVYMNRAGKEMLGLLHSEQQLLSVKHYVEQQMFVKLVAGAKQAKLFGYWESVAQLLKASGDIIHVSIVVVTHRDTKSDELFYSCIARDISQQKLVQEELVRTTLEAEEANKAKSSFLALMSHEVRTPLNGIIGLSSLMYKTEMTAVQRDYLDKMQMSSEMLLRLINDVLDFSKIEAGKIAMEQVPFQLNALLYRLANQLSVFLGGKKQFEFIINTPDHLPDQLIGDAMRLEQVLLNLCMNAIKFTDQGKVELKLVLLEEIEGHQKIQFIIEDSGIGMSKEQLDQLFEPFVQADNSMTRRFGGTGLGLVISKNLVELMNGKLQVASTEGEGSRFDFTLSFAIVTVGAETEADGEELNLGQPVWIVEDDEDMRNYWQHVLESEGWTIIPLNSWLVAKEKLLRVGVSARPMLLLMDLEMPDMYGPDTWIDFHQIAQSMEIPIIALTTTYGQNELLQLPKEEQPTTIVTKPTTRNSLIKSVKNTMLKQHASELAERSDLNNFSEPAATTELQTPFRVLLAEDNKINQLVALELLKESGYEAGLAENGQEALRKLEEEHWDLILMDIHMPVMDGTEAVRVIRSKPAYDATPIIAVTANVVKRDHEQYLKLGMNDIMTKPLSEQVMRQVIAHWLNVKHEPNLATADIIRTNEHEILPISMSGAGMDVRSALDRVNGKAPILIHMMEQFMLDYDGYMNQLRQVMKQGKQANAERMLHTLKGAAGYLSAYELVEATTEVDRLIKQVQPEKADVDVALSVLDEKLTKLLRGLQQEKRHFDTFF